MGDGHPNTAGLPFSPFKKAVDDIAALPPSDVRMSRRAPITAGFLEAIENIPRNPRYPSTDGAVASWASFPDGPQVCSNSTHVSISTMQNPGYLATR
jgi:hypothetical protein